MDNIWLISVFITALGAIAALSAIELVRTRRDKSILQHQLSNLITEIDTLDDRVWEMAASEALHRSLVETMGDLVVRRSSKGRMLYANSAYAALMNLSPETARGQSVEPQVLLRTIGQQQVDGTQVCDELIKLENGQERWISWIETPVTLEGDSTVRQRVGRDVSGRVAAERQLVEARAKAESASDAKSRFLATVSHEFRTPLNGILGMSDLLNDTRLEPEQSAYVRALQSSGKALLSLVDEILDLTKVEAGRVELAQEPFGPAHLIEDVVELMAPRAQTKGLDIAAFIAPDLPSHYRGDEERIRQILVNLLGNAIKFTANGGVALKAHPLFEGEIVTGIEISVEDTGSGIPEDRLEAIFLEFEQANAETARRHGGTGLGLAIVKRLAEAMGGHVNVQSREGEGSVFTVRLPLPSHVTDHAPAGLVTKTGAAPLAAPLAGQNILIISSSPFTAPAMAAIAQAAGAAARLASQNEAIEILAAPVSLPILSASPSVAVPWDAVIIDFAIGSELAETLRLAAVSYGAQKVLVALSPQERRVLGKPVEAGFTGHLVRPVRARSLLDRLMPKLAAAEIQNLPDIAITGRGLRVLVAEDNEINALIVLKTLERHGAEPVWARDGREALNLAEASIEGRSAPFDLVLMDVRMPEMDGLEATEKLRAAEIKHGNTIRLPVIGVSANVAASDIAEARRAGMDDCLPKPLDRDRLFEWLAKIVAKKASKKAA